MKWKDIERELSGRFVSGKNQMTERYIVEWLFEMAKETSDEAWICEIGTLYGSLTVAMALACCGTKRRVVTVDHMIGGHCMDMNLRDKCIYLDFIDNMIALNVWDKIIPFPMKSHSIFDTTVLKGNEILPEKIRDCEYLQASDMLSLMGAQFELIYIDGNHTYENVLAELTLYSKFLKKGGIICGDDCNAEQRPFYESFLNNKGHFESVLAVAKAMLEFFDGNDKFEPIRVPTNQFGFRKKI